MLSSMARRPSAVPGILMNRFGRPARSCNARAASMVRARVVRQQRRHFERDPSVDAVCAVKNGPKEIGGTLEILDCQFEEQPLAR